ncbi:MAG: hypothetical protein ACQKBV_07395, partial [Puniceicoccales bacterium]
LADANGIQAEGYAAEDVTFSAGLKTMLREELARVKAVLDVELLATEPKYLGPPIHLASAN